MFKVEKVFLFLILTLMLSACSALRRGGENIVKLAPDSSWDNVADAVEMNNLKGEDFTFSRFKIKVVDKERSLKASGFIKVKRDGRILISIRSIAGIEIARGLISKDSVKVYDKVNHVLYLQSQEYLKSKYGVSFENLALAWGDIPKGFLNQENEEISNNSYCYMLNVQGDIFQVCIDPGFVKLKSVSGHLEDNGAIRLGYEDLKNEDGGTYPGRISFEIENLSMEVSLELEGFRKETIRNMKFSTGRVKEYIIIK